MLPIILSIAGCSSDYELNKSVYIYDDEFPDLPAYTEWGYNTFGAYYDREVFISNEKVPAKIVVSNNTTAFALYGELESDSYEETSVKFVLSGFNPAGYVDLVSLNDSVIDLPDSGCKVCITRFGIEDTLDIISGKLQIKRAQHLLVDKKSVEAILSGFFEFRAIYNTEPITLSEGRFDVGINKNNFYLLQ